MAKPAYGEAGTVIEAGEYPAVITQVASLGHQVFQGKEQSKYFIELWLPSLEKSWSLSGFGIMSWLTPSRKPYVGLYELISAVTKNPSLSQDEAKTYNVFDLAGKSVNVVFEANDKGYMNVVGINQADGEYDATGQAIITVGIEDFTNPELLETINEKARNLIWQSREFIDGPMYDSENVREAKEKLGGTIVGKEEPSPAFKELNDEMNAEKEEIKIEDVPF